MDQTGGSGVFFNPQTGLLRSGWRALIFAALLISPRFLIASLFSSGVSSGAENDAVFEASFAMIASYLPIIGWVVFISWICLSFLDKLNLSSLGYAFHRGWMKEILAGCGMAAAMIVVVVAIQFIAGGTRVMLNPYWSRNGAIDYGALSNVVEQAAVALVLLILAAVFEELIYRGYPFQTLLRGAPAIVPILLLSLFFGLAHWGNPNRTFFSTANTILAGVWLSVAYLRTRSLWFPTALHFTWNWVMGAFFGIPVSGLLIPRQPLLLSSGGEPLWLTGGTYGSEGGAAATAVLIIATIIIRRSTQSEAR